MKNIARRTLLTLATSVAFATLPHIGFAQENPKQIRIGISSAGSGGKPKMGFGFMATTHLRGKLEEEFKKDGIEVVWNLYPGAGPSTNEAFSNGKIDFGWHGDLPMIVGRSTGLRHKVLFAASRFGPFYFVVPSASDAKSLVDLKGKTISTFKGTAGQLQLSRFLKKYNLKESDFRVISQDGFSARTSLATGDIAGTVVSPWSLESRGVAKRLVEVRDDKSLNSVTSFWVGEDFERKYPQIVQRVVNAFVKEAHWASQEANRDTQYKLWSQSGVPYEDYKKDWDDYQLPHRHSPLLDEFYVETLKKSVQEAKEFRLIRRDVTVDDWLEPKYLKTALKELKLENFWPEFDAQGNVKAKR